jgi:DNA-binding transcriptional regulator YbjK
MLPPRVRALDSALDLLGTAGLRALTHARVDERAGLPRGSTSNYFRTRRALLSGVVERIVEREISEYSPQLAPASAAEFIDGLCLLFDRTSGANRTLTAARLVLFMEAAHDPLVRDAVARGRVEMESALHPVLAGLGAPDPRTSAAAVMACFEGLLLHRIARHDTADPRPVLSLVVRAALG